MNMIQYQFVMISAQKNKFGFNSPRDQPSKQKILFLAKTCSSSALKSAYEDSEEEDDNQVSNFSKLLRQKDRKILDLMEKIKYTENQLNMYKNDYQNVKNDLQFYKTQIKEEFNRNDSLETQIDHLNMKIKTFILKIGNALQTNSNLIPESLKKIQSQQTQYTDNYNLELSKKLITSLQDQIGELNKEIKFLKTKSQKKQEQFNCSIDYYKTKSIDFEQYKRQIQGVRGEKEFIQKLLVISQREKGELHQKIYEIARRDYQVDFEKRTKQQVIKLCIGLLIRLKDLEHDHVQFEKRLNEVETLEKQKYEDLMKTVKKIEKDVEKGKGLKRMKSLQCQG